jgi:polyhydroxybutyrate depolymerase
MPRYILLSSLLVGCTSLGAVTPQDLAPGRYPRDFVNQEVTRHYILRVPPAYDGKSPKPLVVVLHGWGTSGTLAEGYTKMADGADKHGYISVFPDGLGQTKGWNAGFIDLSGQKKDDVKFVSDLIDEVSRQVKVDPNRIYVCGHSNGAFLTHAVGAGIGNRLAAIGAVAGTIGIPRANTHVPDPKWPVNVLIFHGKQDPTVAFSQTSKALLTGYGAEESAKWWADKDGISAPPKVTKVGGIETTTYGGTSKGPEVVLITSETGIHAWPGGYNDKGPETVFGANAADLLFAFFDRHVRGK